MILHSSHSEMLDHKKQRKLLFFFNKTTDLYIKNIRWRYEVSDLKYLSATNIVDRRNLKFLFDIHYHYYPLIYNIYFQ